MSMFIPAKELDISHADNPEKWKWSCRDGNSSEEVAELLKVHWLELRAYVKVKELQKTSYSAYLVFELKDSTENLEKATAAVRFTNEITHWELEEGYVVFLDKQSNRPMANGRFPQVRNDGWMEIKLGEFSNLGDDEEVEIRLRDNNTRYQKSGLVVRGIDLRPNFTCYCQGNSEPVFEDCSPYVWAKTTNLGGSAINARKVTKRESIIVIIISIIIAIIIMISKTVPLMSFGHLRETLSSGAVV